MARLAPFRSYTFAPIRYSISFRLIMITFHSIHSIAHSQAHSLFPFFHFILSSAHSNSIYSLAEGKSKPPTSSVFLFSSFHIRFIHPSLRIRSVPKPNPHKLHLPLKPNSTYVPFHSPMLLQLHSHLTPLRIRSPPKNPNHKKAAPVKKARLKTKSKK